MKGDNMSNENSESQNPGVQGPTDVQQAASAQGPVNQNTDTTEQGAGAQGPVNQNTDTAWQRFVNNPVVRRCARDVYTISLASFITYFMIMASAVIEKSQQQGGATVTVKTKIIPYGSETYFVIGDVHNPIQRVGFMRGDQVYEIDFNKFFGISPKEAVQKGTQKGMQRDSQKGKKNNGSTNVPPAQRPEKNGPVGSSPRKVLHAARRNLPRSRRNDFKRRA